MDLKEEIMENKSDINSQYPSVELAYEFVKSSYEVMTSRFESANSRIQNLLTWAIGITAIIPLFTKVVIGTDSFKPVWFISALVAFLAMVIVGIVAQRTGGVKLIDPKILYEKHLHYSQWEFKKNLIFWAGDSFHINNKAIEAKSRYIDIMTILFGLEIALAFIGVIMT